MSATEHRVRGFLLTEVVLGLLVSGIVFSALAAGLVALMRSLQPARITINGEALPVAPAFGAFPAAVRVHQTLITQLVSARAVYVFGGRHLSIPTDAPPNRMKPLSLAGLPKIADLTSGLPLDAETFYERYAASLGELVATPTPDDFTVLVIGDDGARLAPTCVVQVRRTDAAVTDGGSMTKYVVRNVVLWYRGGTERYVFAERPLQSAGVFIGAVHTWMRFGLDPAELEEGPACVVFPDPWLFAGSRIMGGDEPPFSRFVYLLPVSR